MTNRNYLIVGHGGQGILDLGNFIAYDAMDHGLHVAYTPSYGPETRGGKVRCFVITSDEKIDSPIIDEPDVLVAMNNPSMDFESLVKVKGVMLMNTSLIDRSQTRHDIQVFRVPATGIADSLKDKIPEIRDTRVLQNAVMYGAIIAVEGLSIAKKGLQSVLEHAYAGPKSKFIPANIQAVELGHYFIAEQLAEFRQSELWGPSSAA